jgi:methylmalonyl-CoA/ethylmalonyl-CoA epimerase
MKKDWKIHHLGFIVSDMDKAIEYYKSLGIATVGPELPIVQSPDGAKLKVRFAQIGSIVLEFFQPVEGESMQLDFLRKHGEGIQHMAFVVADIDAEVDDLVSKGIKLIFRADMPTGIRIAYFDTSQIGDVLIELVQQVEKDALAKFLKLTE